MKRFIFLISIVFSIISPTLSQKHVILNSNITSSLDTAARDMITLNPGFEFSLTGGDSLCLNIDDQIIAGVEYDYSDNLPDETRTLDQNLEVGTTGGVFSVSNSGTAQYNIPLNLPVGIRGMQPRLSIVYNQGGPGLLGYGFTLNGLSQISYTYPTKYNDDTYGSIDSKKYLSLNGERLIETTIGGYIYYRPEYGDKSIIKEWSSPIQHFNLYNPDRSIVRFGETSNSQLSCGSGSWSFYITSITDKMGNAIKYSYLDKADANSEVLLDRIDYHISGAQDPYATIIFCYVDDIVEGNTWGVKGRLIESDHILRKIKIQYGSDTEREYNFHYTKFQQSGSDPEQIYSYLYKIEEQDSYGNTYNPLVFTWDERPVDSPDSLLILLRYNEYGVSSQWTNRKYYPGDIDGDGIMELVGDTLPTNQGGSSPAAHTIDVIDDLSWRKVARPAGYKSFVLGDFDGDLQDEILWYDGGRSTTSRQYHKENKKSSGADLSSTEFLILEWNGSVFIRKDTVNPTSISDDRL